MVFKKAYDINGAPEEQKEAIDSRSQKDKAVSSGIGGDPIYEPVPKYIQTSSEKVIKNKNNAWIVLGRDRPQGRFSGYGGAGHTQCASIDIVTGRKGTAQDWTDPDFKRDAARIYVSQKTDVDANFGLAAGLIGSTISINASTNQGTNVVTQPPASISRVVPRSTVAMKADGVRIIAREGIKLVTGVDSQNSQDGAVRSIAGVNIIAGNDDSDMQPLVKGDNLTEALSRMVDHIDSLAGNLDTFLTHQMTYNKAIANHFHHSPFWGQMTTVSPACQITGMKTMLDLLSQTKRSIVFLKTNLRGFQSTYLTQFGEKYINSRFNFLN